MKTILPKLIVFAIFLLSSASHALDFSSVERQIAEGNAADVLDEIEDAIDEGPVSADLYYWLGRAEIARVFDVMTIRQPFVARAAKSAWEQALEIDPSHIPAREALFSFMLQAPGVVGGSEEEAKAHAEMLMQQDKAAGLRAASQMAFAEEKPKEGLDLIVQASEADPAHWGSAFMAVTAAVDQQDERAKLMLERAQAVAKLESEDQAEQRQARLDYQMGKLAATTGRHLDDGRSALERFLADADDEDQFVPWAQFRLGQIERHSGNLQQARSRLENLRKQRIDGTLEDAVEAELELLPAAGSS